MSGPMPKPSTRAWGCRPCESLDLGLQVLYLITELTVATGKGAKSILGRRGEASEVLTKPSRGRDNQGLHLVDCLGASLDGRVLGALEHTDHFDFTLT